MTNSMTSKNVKEKEVDTYYDDLVTFIVKKWKDSGTVKDEQDARDTIEMMLYLLGIYRFKCLFDTFFEMEEYINEFEALQEKDKNEVH